MLHYLFSDFVKRGYYFSKSQRKGSNLENFVRDKGYKITFIDKHGVHMHIEARTPGKYKTIGNLVS